VRTARSLGPTAATTSSMSSPGFVMYLLQFWQRSLSSCVPPDPVRRDLDEIRYQRLAGTHTRTVTRKDR
jgi:hypothetical protein